MFVLIDSSWCVVWYSYFFRMLSVDVVTRFWTCIQTYTYSLSELCGSYDRCIHTYVPSMSKTAVFEAFSVYILALMTLKLYPYCYQYSASENNQKITCFFSAVCRKKIHLLLFSRPRFCKKKKIIIIFLSGSNFFHSNKICGSLGVLLLIILSYIYNIRIIHFLFIIHNTLL